MTVPADRPAADDVQRLERGRELRALVAGGTLTEHDVDAVWTYLGVRERLARAEQALAEAKARPEGLCSFGMCRCSTSGVPCYGRASQGGQ